MNLASWFCISSFSANYLYSTIKVATKKREYVPYALVSEFKGSGRVMGRSRGWMATCKDNKDNIKAKI